MNSTVLYLTISEGSRADKARPILAISDQRLIAALLDSVRDLANPDGDKKAAPPSQIVARESESGR